MMGALQCFENTNFKSTSSNTDVLNILYFKNELWINGIIKSISLGALKKRTD